MKKRLGILILLGMILLPGAGRGQDSLNVSMVWNSNYYWDSAWDVVVQGDYAYVTTCSTGLKIVDVSIPEAPIEVGCCRTPREDYDKLDIQGDYCYVADGDAGLRIIDVSEPTAPFEVSVMNFNFSVEDVKVYDCYAYLANSQDGLKIVDISNPANPVLTGSYDTQHALCLELYYPYIFLGDMTGTSSGNLKKFDVSDPSHPLQQWTKILDGYARDIAIQVPYIYVVEDPNVLQIFRLLASPTTPPQLKSQMELSAFVGEVDIVRNYLQVADWMSGLCLVDVSNANAPQVAKVFNSIGCVRGVFSDDRYSYIADEWGGLRIINISNQSFQISPVEIGYFDPPESVTDVVVSDSIAFFILSRDGIKIMDISDMQEPIELSTYHINPTFWTTLTNIAIDDSKAYLTDSDYGMRVLDISNPQEPALIGGIAVAGYAEDVAIKDTLAFLTDFYDGLYVYDISNPANIVMLSNNQFWLHAYGIVLRGDYAFAAQSSHGLSILDISNPYSPLEIGECETEGSVFNIALKDNYCFASNLDGGVYIFDISNYFQPFIADSIVTSNAVFNVVVSGNNLLVSEQYYGIRIYDITNPLHPEQIAYYNTPGIACGAAFMGDDIILADTDYMEVLQLSTDRWSESIPLNQILSTFALFPPSPNPFNNSTTITFTLAKAGEVKLAVYDILGREVQSLVIGHLSLGKHEMVWEAEGVGSGVYFIQLTEAGGQAAVKKVVLMK